MSAPSPRPRILFLIDHAVVTGGAERFAVALATRLPADRFEPTMCITRYADAPTLEALDDAGVGHLVLERGGKSDVHRLRGLAALLRSQRFDIVHAHMFGSSLWAALMGTAAGVPAIIAQEHGSAFDSRPRAWLDANIIARAAARYVAVSAADGEQMATRHRIPREKIVVIPNGYVPRSVTSTTEVRGELGIPPDAPMIGVAAVLRPEKRIDLLLDAFARVRTSLPGARLVIAGSGPCHEDLQHTAERLGLSESVSFLGVRTDVDSILAASDVSALSSDREGSPLLMFECMANGTPLVATAVGGIPEVIEDGRSGILVPRRDPEALARALLRVLRDHDLAAALAAAGRTRLAEFTIDAVVARYIELYRTLIEPRGG